ncbi:MAG: DUF3261 domain-containing protein [Treponema sp.]|jgi:hypothetical protein|nr:DUF3261 domain-containing protein [Treponema sp.]
MDKYFIGRSLLVGIMIILGAVSCATIPKASPYSPVYITDRSKYILLPPSDIEVSLDMPQQIAGRYGKQEFVMDAWALADEDGINLALLNSFGANMGELKFSDGTLSFSSPLLPSSIKPEYIVADFQFCFYRVDALAEALKACGLNLLVEQRHIENEGSVEIRTITEDKKIIIEIEKTVTAVRYRNLLRGYAYTLGGAF